MAFKQRQFTAQERRLTEVSLQVDDLPVLTLNQFIKMLDFAKGENLFFDPLTGCIWLNNEDMYCSAFARPAKGKSERFPYEIIRISSRT